MASEFRFQLFLKPILAPRWLLYSGRMNTTTQPTTPAFVDTPKGMFTASGIWFRAQEADACAYAGDVLDHESLDRLVRQAETWLRSSQTLTLWVLPVLLVLFPVGPAVAGATVSFVAWRLLGPSFVNRPMLRLFALMDHAVLQLLFYVIVLSVLAAGEQFGSLVAGLAGFVLLRWGVLRWATDPLQKRLWPSLYALPAPDQVLRAVIRRAALVHRIALPELDTMGRDILGTWYRTK